MYPSIDLTPPNSTASTSRAWAWVVETLMEIGYVDTSILQYPMSAIANYRSYCSESLIEKILVKYLEEWLDSPQWSGPPLQELLPVDGVSQNLFLLLLHKATASNDLVKDGVEFIKHDLQQFILDKRAILPSNSGYMMMKSIQEDEEFLQDPCEEHSEQNGEELQLLKQISSAIVADIGSEILQGYPVGFGQESLQQSELFQLLSQKISAACTTDEELLQVYRKLTNRHEVVQATANSRFENHLLHIGAEGETIENGPCIKCGGGGLCLICSSHNCSLSIHERCIDSAVNLDVKGDVYCTLCSLTQAAVEYYRAKEKYSQATKAFASLSVKNSVGVLRETNQAGNMNCHKKNQAQKRNSGRIEYHEEKEAPTHCETENLPRVGESFETTRRRAKRRKSNFQMNGEIAEMHLEKGNATCVDSKANMRSEAFLNSDMSDIHDKTPRMRQNPPGNVVVKPLAREGSTEGERLHTTIPIHHPYLRTGNHLGALSSTSDLNGRIMTNTKQLNKREKIPWTPEEEQALKNERVKYSQDNGRVPWTKIYKAIEDVIHEDRRPQDLKDKWINIMKKKSWEQKEDMNEETANSEDERLVQVQTGSANERPIRGNKCPVI